MSMFVKMGRLFRGGLWLPSETGAQARQVESFLIAHSTMTSAHIGRKQKRHSPSNSACSAHLSTLGRIAKSQTPITVQTHDFALLSVDHIDQLKLCHLDNVYTDHHAIVHRCRQA
jgi:hypothetical protein